MFQTGKVPVHITAYSETIKPCGSCIHLLPGYQDNTIVVARSPNMSPNTIKNTALLSVLVPVLTLHNKSTVRTDGSKTGLLIAEFSGFGQIQFYEVIRRKMILVTRTSTRY